MSAHLQLAVYDHDPADAPEPPDAALDLDELRQAYGRHMAGRGRAAKSVRAALMSITYLLDYTQWRTLGQITVAGVDEYLTQRRAGGWSAHTHDNNLSTYRSWGTWLAKTKRWDHNLFANLEAIGNSTGECGEGSRAITTDELRRLVEAAQRAELYASKRRGYRRARVYMVAAHTGLRHGELHKLTRAECWLDEAPPSIVLHANKAKNRKRSRIPLCPAAADALRAEIAEFASVGGLVFAKFVEDKTFRRDLARARIPYRDDRGRTLSFHGLRKYFATQLIAKGTDLTVVQRLMRHSDIRLTVNQYNDVPDGRLVAAVDRLPEIALAPQGDAGPLNDISRARAVDGEGPRPLSVDEFCTLFCWLDRTGTKQMRTRSRFYALGFLTGLRYGEMKGLRVADIRDDHLVVWAGVSKSRKTQRVVLCDATRKLLTVQAAGKGPGDPLFDPAPRRETLRADCGRAGVDPTRIGMHSLRKGFATELDARGVSPGTVAAMMRHATPTITFQHYIRPDERATIERFAKMATAVGGEESGGGTPQDHPECPSLDANVCDRVD